MSFRLISVPLNKRTEQEPRINELTTDTVHGNVGVYTTKKDKMVYNSGTENIKSDIDSLKIRNRLSCEDLSKISYGSENNVEDKDFNITKALEDRDILGSLQYIINQYSQYVKGFDSNGNVILKETAFEYSDELKNIIKKIYDKADYSYDYKFKKILENVYTTDQPDPNQSTNVNTNTVDYLKLQKLILDYIPAINKIDSKLTKLEKIIETINNDLNINISNDIKDITSDLDELLYNTKAKKFRSDTELNSLFAPSQDIENYQTENADGQYHAPIEDLVGSLENKSNVFESNFVTSILDENYDGDLNLHQIDGLYNIPSLEDRTRMTGNYIIDKQKYFYLSDIDEYQNLSLVYDPELKKPIYRTNTVPIPEYASDKNDNLFSSHHPFLESYLNDNNYIMRYVYQNYSNPNKLFTCKNANGMNIVKLFHYNNNIYENTESFPSYYFPTFYLLDSSLTPNITFTFIRDNFNFDYFKGLHLIKLRLSKDINSLYYNWIIRKSLFVYANDPQSIISVYTNDDHTMNEDYRTLVRNRRFDDNNRNILAYEYYRGVYEDNNTLNILSLDEFKNNFNKYLTSLEEKISNLNESMVYPTLDGTDVLMGYGDNHSVILNIKTLTSSSTVIDKTRIIKYEHNYDVSQTPAVFSDNISLLENNYGTFTLDNTVYNITTPPILDHSFTLSKALVDVVNFYNSPTSYTTSDVNLVINTNLNDYII